MSETDTKRIVNDLKEHIGVKDLVRWLKWSFCAVVTCTVAVTGFIFEVRGNIREISEVTLRTQTTLQSVMIEHREMDRRLERHETLLGTLIHRD